MLPEIKLLMQKQLVEDHGEEFCYKIANNPKDVSHEFYKDVFEGYEWSIK